MSSVSTIVTNKTTTFNMTHAKYQTANPFSSVLNEFFFSPVWDKPAARQHAAATNILETDKGFRLEVAAPGFEKEDFFVKIEKNILTIGAKNEAQTEEGQSAPQYRRREFVKTAFERSFRLPETIDNEQVNATLVNGILYVELVKKPELVPAIKTITVA
jgi:HSP20 family protein